MTIFENSETKIEIKSEFFGSELAIIHKNYNLLIDTDIKSIDIGVNLSNYRLIKIKGENGKLLKIIFLKDFIRFSDGFFYFDLYSPSSDLEEIREKFEEFARDFTEEYGK